MKTVLDLMDYLSQFDNDEKIREHMNKIIELFGYDMEA